jgi:hypothetical protein
MRVGVQVLKCTLSRGVVFGKQLGGAQASCELRATAQRAVGPGSDFKVLANRVTARGLSPTVMACSRGLARAEFRQVLESGWLVEPFS